MKGGDCGKSLFFYHLFPQMVTIMNLSVFEIIIVAGSVHSIFVLTNNSNNRSLVQKCIMFC